MAPASRLAHARRQGFRRVGPEHLRILVRVLLLTRREQHLAGVIGDEGPRILLPHRSMQLGQALNDRHDPEIVAREKPTLFARISTRSIVGKLIEEQECARRRRITRPVDIGILAS